MNDKQPAQNAQTTESKTATTTNIMASVKLLKIRTGLSAGPFQVGGPAS